MVISMKKSFFFNSKIPWESLFNLRFFNF
jgi:hypothetical protein